MRETVIIAKRVYYVDDCKRLQRVAIDNQFELSLLQCQAIWTRYSEDWFADWLILPSSDLEIWGYMQELIEEDLSYED